MSKLHLTEQVALIRKAEKQSRALSEVLAAAGWTYDDLIYRKSSFRGDRKGTKPLLLNEFSAAKGGPQFVSFFSGCGGMDLGLEAIGWKHRAAFEISELFCKTLCKNRPHWQIYGPPMHSGDVSDFDSIEQILSTQIKTPFEGVFVGGPPCQPFSIASNQRFAKWGNNFKRTGFSHQKNGNLLFDFVRLITAFSPRAFIIENVPGLHDIDNGRQLSKAIEDLTLAGYSVHPPFVVNAAEFGVAQERYRLFVIGSRSSKSFAPPQPLQNRAECSTALHISKKLQNHETREHKAESIKRYMELEYGARDQLGRVDRLDPTLPAKTVIAGGTNGGGRSHLHPEIPRTLSVRECARLQSFPDDFVFVGPTARQFTHVGNAVPPVLAAQIGIAVAQSFF